MYIQVMGPPLYTQELQTLSVMEKKLGHTHTLALTYCIRECMKSTLGLSVSHTLSFHFCKNSFTHLLAYIHTCSLSLAHTHTQART